MGAESSMMKRDCACHYSSPFETIEWELHSHGDAAVAVTTRKQENHANVVEYTPSFPSFAADAGSPLPCWDRPGVCSSGSASWVRKAGRNCPGCTAEQQHGSR